MFKPFLKPKIVFALHQQKSRIQTSLFIRKSRFAAVFRSKIRNRRFFPRPAHGRNHTMPDADGRISAKRRLFLIAVRFDGG